MCFFAHHFAQKKGASMVDGVEEGPTPQPCESLVDRPTLVERRRLCRKGGREILLQWWRETSGLKSDTEQQYLFPLELPVDQDPWHGNLADWCPVFLHQKGDWPPDSLRKVVQALGQDPSEWAVWVISPGVRPPSAGDLAGYPARVVPLGASDGSKIEPAAFDGRDQLADLLRS